MISLFLFADIYILEQENIGKFFVREAGKENKVMKSISVIFSLLRFGSSTLPGFEFK